MRLGLIFIIVCACLSGCGHKGPLTLPQSNLSSIQLTSSR
ncbi:MAG: lipoprotein [Gallionella sp.]|nr:lipoprotein [Gallionella sp.]MDD4959096.1 lipoprotein [Gallionella sp.]